jgi:hypothetical protein
LYLVPCLLVTIPKKVTKVTEINVPINQFADVPMFLTKNEKRKIFLNEKRRMKSEECF